MFKIRDHEVGEGLRVQEVPGRLAVLGALDAVSPPSQDLHQQFPIQLVIIDD
jgi:hypothetical protein